MTTPKPGTLQTITYATLLVTLIGYLLVVGYGLILPILIALISVYIMGAVDNYLASWPGTRHMPAFLRRLLLILAFIGILAAFTSLIIVTVQQLIQQAPGYQENLQKILVEVTNMLGMNKVPDWPTIYDATIGRLNIQNLVATVGASISSFGGSLFLVIIYVSFLFGEKARFGDKLEAAFTDPERAQRTRSVISEINTRIGQYLGAKTLINVILGVISYVILIAFGVDYAAFWALLIGLLNYIPYIGSIIALLLPVLLSVVQFASLPRTLGLFIGLQTAQIIVGNFLEPKMVGRRVNLSAFVVLVSLAFWAAIWGIAGAILAVPLTSMLVIIFSQLEPTRPLAVLMSDDVKVLRADERRAKAAQAKAAAGQPLHRRKPLDVTAKDPKDSR